tara:strand:+ start:215 stop:463 length:249 start_codon:yes stop_codon:yes gene_type:complete
MGRMKELAREQQERAAHGYDDTPYFIDKLRRENNDRLDVAIAELNAIEKQLNDLIRIVQENEKALKELIEIKNKIDGTSNQI